MKRVFLFLLVLTLILTACAPAATPAPTAAPARTTAPNIGTPTTAPPASGLTLKDGLARSISLPAAAKKVVSLAPSNTEILYAIGAAGQLIGRDDLSDFPEEAKKVASVGGNMGKFNYEVLAKLQPDLVLASPLNTPEQIKAMEDLKLVVFVLANPVNLDEMYQNIQTVGSLTNHSDEAKALVAKLKARQQKVADTLASIKDRPKVFYELDATEPAKPYTAGANTFIDLLINLSGGVNIAAKLKGDYPQISQEELVAQNPDIILLGDAAYGMTPDQVVKRAGWNTIKAVKDNKVMAVDDNLVSRPGPRLLDGLEAMAKQIHPELFK